MKVQRLLVALTMLNLVILVFTLARFGPAMAQSAPPGVLRGRLLEIVDDLGRVRAGIAVLPASGGSRETVLLRLITEYGRPSIKISASEDSAGMSLVGPSGTQNTYIIVEAKGKTSAVTLKNEDGGQQILKP